VKEKSLLDGIPVKTNEEFDKLFNRQGCCREVVSQCPKCGSPIYGQKSLIGNDSPAVEFSCNCRIHTMNLEIRDLAFHK